MWPAPRAIRPICIVDAGPMLQSIIYDYAQRRFLRSSLADDSMVLDLCRRKRDWQRLQPDRRRPQTTQPRQCAGPSHVLDGNATCEFVSSPTGGGHPPRHGPEEGALNSAPQRRASTATTPAATSHTSFRNRHGYTEPKLRRCRHRRGPTREGAQGRELCRSGGRSSRSFAGRCDLTNDRCTLEVAFDAAPRRKTEVGRKRSPRTAVLAPPRTPSTGGNLSFSSRAAAQETIL